MVRVTPAVLVAVGLAVASSALAGQFNKKLSIGDAAPSFSDLEGVDGKKHGLDDYKARDVVVLVLTCNHCPVAEAHEDRLIALAKKYGGADSKVAVVAICVNNIEPDRLDKMKERAKTKKFNFDYLHDPGQKIPRAYGATVTPEFFVLNKERKIVYMGAMDDEPQDPDKVKVRYVEDAIKAVLDGKKPEKAETRPFGCGVVYEEK